MDGMNNNPFSNDEWIQQYPNTSVNDQHHGTTTAHAPITISSSVYGQGPTGGQDDGPKPIRRRSRASRRTPTTILNASPNDFRALVQRFTGCNSKDHDDHLTTSVSSVMNNLPKGPVNIDFARNDVKEAASSSRYTSYAINNNNNNNVNQVMRLPLHGDQQQMQSVDGHHMHAGNYEIMDDASVLNYESSLLVNDTDSGGFNI
uniref:uncharacterized protein LOC122580303 n=1 Tax=Erigeron canadensis TaxID=72917 RepID=UPI001CB9A441|nr:uncharacterized protein LOC122580303 [Erigeron canadensis]